MLRRGAAVLLTAVVTLGASAACGGSGTHATAPGPVPSPALPPAPEPSVAPEPGVPPAGRVIQLGSPVEGIAVDDRTNTAVAALRGGRLALLDAGTGALRRVVGVPGTARHLQLARPGGPVLVPGEDTDLLVQVGLPQGQVIASTRVGRQPHDAAYDPASSRIVVADELAGSVSFLTDGRTAAQLAGPVQPGGVAVAGGRAAVVDVRGAALYVYDVAAARQIARLPAGNGPTHTVALPGDRVVVADTRGGALLVYALDGTPRQVASILLAGGPYGIAVDIARRRLYVALSATNQLLTFAVADPTGDGAVLHRIGAAIPTVRQPNSVGVEPRTGTLFIGSADDPGSVQVVPAP